MFVEQTSLCSLCKDLNKDKPPLRFDNANISRKLTKLKLRTESKLKQKNMV